jgi:hypothetical protein
VELYLDPEMDSLFGTELNYLDLNVASLITKRSIRWNSQEDGLLNTILNICHEAMASGWCLV